MQTSVSWAKVHWSGLSADLINPYANSPYTDYPICP